MNDVIVYDANDNFYRMPEPFIDAYREWLRDHGIDPDKTSRTEHRVIDVPLVRVVQPLPAMTIDPVTLDSELTYRTVDVLIKSPPPNPEDYA